MPVAPLLGPGLVARRLRVSAREVVFIKGVLDASEGVGTLFAERGGNLVIVATESTVAELDRILRDLVREVGGEFETRARRSVLGVSSDRCDGDGDPLA